MTRILVMQLFEALIHAVPSDQEDEQAEAIAAITEAREYLATEPSGERAELIKTLKNAAYRTDDAVLCDALDDTAEMLEADAHQASTPAVPDGYVLVPIKPTEEMLYAWRQRNHPYSPESFETHEDAVDWMNTYNYKAMLVTAQGEIK